MKTSVNMLRKMGTFDVVQRTSDGKFNATDMLAQWNKSSAQKKQMNDFIRLSQTKTFIEELKKDIEDHEGISPDADSQVFEIKKGRNTKKGKTPDISWYHPYLYIKFAMWLNPRFEIQVIKFVYDQLIDYRHDAGDNFNGLMQAVQRFSRIDYRQLAKGLNWVVFNRHEKDIRNSATTTQLKDLVDLQKQIAFAVDMGYIKTFEKLIDEMRRLYKNKWDNFRSLSNNK